MSAHLVSAGVLNQKFVAFSPLLANCKRDTDFRNSNAFRALPDLGNGPHRRDFDQLFSRRFLSEAGASKFDHG